MISSTPESVSSAHPLVDDRGAEWVASFTDRSIVHASVARTGFLVDANRAQMVPVIVTDSSARMTWPMLQLIAEFGAVWLAQASDGSAINALSGRSSSTIGEAVADRLRRATPGAIEAPEIPAALPEDSGRLLQITMIVHHRAHVDTILGGALEAVAEFVGGAVQSWGETEPLARSWNASEMTARVRQQMPETVRYLAASIAPGHELSATVRVARTQHGVTEQLRVLASVPDDDLISHVGGLFEAIAAQFQVVFASAFHTSGRADLTFGVDVAPTPAPIAVLVGAKAVRDTAVDLAALVNEVGAVRLGRSRTPSALLTFDIDPAEAWRQLRRAATFFDPSLLGSALGFGVTDAS